MRQVNRHGGSIGGLRSPTGHRSSPTLERTTSPLMSRLTITEAFAKYRAVLRSVQWSVSAWAPDVSLVVSLWAHHYRKVRTARLNTPTQQNDGRAPERMSFARTGRRLCRELEDSSRGTQNSGDRTRRSWRERKRDLQILRPENRANWRSCRVRRQQLRLPLSGRLTNEAKG